MKKRKILAAFAFAATSLSVGYSQAQYWDTNGATSGLGGTGNWDGSTANWNSSNGTGTATAWGNTTSSSAIFSGTAGIVTLNSSGLVANSLAFTVDGYTVADSLANALTLGGTTPTIDVASAATATFSTGVIAGSGGLTKTGAGTLVIQSASTLSGNLTINGGTVSLGTSTGSLVNVNGVSVARGATLQLNNSSVGNNNNNRLGNVDVALNAGTLNFVGIQAASGSSESINRIVLGSGASTLSLASSTGSGAQLGTLTLGNATAGFSLSAGSTLSFENDANGAVSVTAYTETNNIVGGWFTFDPSNFAALSGTNNGTVQAVTADETSFGTSNWAATENVRVASGGGAFTVGSDRSVNSLVLFETTARTNVINSTRTLTIGSGGLIMTGANHLINGPGSITSGAGGEYMLYVHTTGATSRTQTIGAIIANNGSNVVSLVKAGAQTLLLTGANTFNGTTYVNEGTLSLNTGVSGTNAISGNVIITGGTLSYGSTANQINDTVTVSMSAGGFDLGARAETIGALNMTGGTLSRGGAILTLAGNSSITGGTLNFTSSGSSRITTQGNLALGGATFSFDSGTSAGTLTVALGGNVSYSATNTGATTFSNSLAGIGRLDLGSSVTRVFDVADSTTLASGTPEITVGWTVTGSSSTLEKNGTGAILLSAANTYSGGTTIKGGTLTVTNATALGTGNVTISGGALTTGVASVSAAGFTMSSGNFTLNGASAGTVSITGGNNLSLTGGTWFYTNGDSFTAATNTSVFSISGTTLDLTGLGQGSYTLASGFASSGNSFTGFTYANLGNTLSASADFSAGVLTLTVVPEPHEYALGVAGLLVLLVVLRRRREARSS